MFQTSQFAKIGASSGSPGIAVVTNLYQIAAGLAVGLGVGYTMKAFNYCDPKKTLPYKLLIMVIMGIGFPIACDLIGFYESKYIGIIFFGFMCHHHWKHDKPEKELAFLWAFL